MGNIVLLDELTINKIAAGEVIERPASVVKELVENSIDAGATNISVEIKNGGISYIRITDNGKGMAPDDMEIAFERHATSKIRSAEDLETVKSMGFRGEALASIAAIAKVEMKSKMRDIDTGYRVVVEGGNVISSEETGCPNGTTVTIENLFYNTPVRYKFLKKDFTEAGYIEDVMTRIALINPDIAIKFISSGKTIIQTPGNGALKGVVYNIYGKEISENTLDVDYTYEDIRVTGVVGKPCISRSNRSNQLFFVNKRYIKDKTLTSSAEQAFKGMITIGKFGFLVLNLDMNPQKVDVNVHPAKLEVRFEEESKVFKAVYHAIKDTLLKSDLVSDPEKDYTKDEESENEVKEKSKFGLFHKNEVKEENNDINEEEEKNNFIAQIFEKRQLENNSLENKEYINSQEYKEQPKLEENDEKYEADEDETQKIEKTEVMGEVVKESQNIEETQVINVIPEMDKTQVVNIEEVIEKSKELENMKMEPTNQFDEMYTSIFGKMPVKEKEEIKAETINNEEIKTAENISMFENIQNDKYVKKYKFIGISFSTYIIVELDNELYIIDQHAAHERIMYERIKQNYYNDMDKDSQLMLLPDIINLTHKEMDILNENIDMFRRAGFTLEEFGENTIKLMGVPNVCIDLDTKELFLETLDEINTVARTAKQEIEEKFIATVACKAAVKAHMALNEKEVDSLMKQLLKLPNPFTCPHGRPTAIRMSKIDIEKKFSRR